MAGFEFVIDDIDAAKAFIGTLNRKVVRLRFSLSGEWEPSHIVLVQKDGQTVAMADSIVFADNVAAIGSLLTRPGFSGYAIPALLRLK